MGGAYYTPEGARLCGPLLPDFQDMPEPGLYSLAQSSPYLCGSISLCSPRSRPRWRRPYRACPRLHPLHGWPKQPLLSPMLQPSRPG